MIDVRPAPFTPEMLEWWNVTQPRDDFRALVREFSVPYQRLESGVVYRDRRSVRL